MVRVIETYQISNDHTVLICPREEIPENIHDIFTPVFQFSKDDFEIVNCPECFSPSKNCAILLNAVVGDVSSIEVR